MTALLGALLLVALALVIAPLSVLLLQVACAVLPRRAPAAPAVERPRVAVLVPAHNESAGIAASLDTVLPQLAAGDRLLVVADNCTDDTARVAAAAGAEVLERHDTARRGKGYALDCGVRHLAHDPPQVVVVVDADCEVGPGAIDRIARLSAARARPVQALYLMRAPRAAGALAPVAEFAWIVRNLVRPLGLLRLGLPCQLMGTGMAFPWTVIRSARLASGNIVEDLKLGVDLARAGTPPLFCPDALVASRFPAGAAAARGQRTRWEHGHLATIAEEAPRLLLEAARRRDIGMLALALDLCVPPLALLTLAIVMLLCLSLAYALATASLAPLGLAAAAALMLAAAVGVSWLRFGRDIAPLSSLALAFAYALGKLPLYLRFVTRRQVEWVRSRRDGG